MISTRPAKAIPQALRYWLTMVILARPSGRVRSDSDPSPERNMKAMKNSFQVPRNEKIPTVSTWPSRETITIEITSPAYKAWYDYYSRIIPKNGIGSGDYDISVNETAEEVKVEFRNVVRLTADYVILGATLDLN